MERRQEQNRQLYLRSIADLAETTFISTEGKIENLFGDPHCIKIGENSFIRGRLLTYGHGGNIKIGDWFYLGERSEIWSMDLIEIGNYVLIGHDVNIHDGTGHPLDALQRREHYRKIRTTGHPRMWEEMPGVRSAPIIIEDDVSIGFGTTIFQGVRIGARSVIAPCSVITKDVPSDVMYMSMTKPLITPLSMISKMRAERKQV
jgi:maltose O-acetyltransferase